MVISRIPQGFEAILPSHLGNGTIVLQAKKITPDDEDLSAYLTIRLQSNSSFVHVFSGKIRLTSPRSRKTVANYIEEVVKNTPLQEFEWAKIIERFAVEVCNKTNEPIFAAPLDVLESVPPVEYLLFPLLPKRVPSLIYAPGGAGKSILALYFAILVQSGYDLRHNPTAPANCLYIDWELDRFLMNTRFNQIVIEDIEEKKPPFYLRASRPLSDEVDNILENIAKYNITFVVIDSAALAMGGDIIDASSVINFFREVRKLNEAGATVLIISHVSKAHKERGDGALPVGSIFFENLARNTWELKFWRIHETQRFVYALYNRKSNFGLHEPIAVSIEWKDGLAFISRDADLSDARTGNTVSDMILELLQEGDFTVAELAKQIGVPNQSVSSILNRLKREGYIERKGEGKWGLVR